MIPLIQQIAAKAAGQPMVVMARMPTWTNSSGVQPAFSARRAWEWTAPCRCAPPENKPAPGELAACRSWLEQELLALPNASVYLALGKTGYDAVTGLVRGRTDRAQRRTGAAPALDAPPFSHRVEATIPDPRGGPVATRLFAS